MPDAIESSLDLVLTRDVDVTPEEIWGAWTEPEQLIQWFTPKPWITAECEIDLRPGGRFRTVMRGPEGEEFDGSSCYLEVVPNRRLVWTSALAPGYRPQSAPEGGFTFTAFIEMERAGNCCKYTATVIHESIEDKLQHESMGFHSGWGTALDQLVEMAKSRR